MENNYKYQIPIFGISLGLVLLLILALSRFGLGVSPDSTAYLDGSNQIMSGEGYRYYHWPIGYSFLISVFRIPLDDFFSIRVIGIIMNILFFLITMFISWKVIDKYNFSYKIKYVIFFIHGSSIFQVSLMWWSELPFILVFNSIFLILINKDSNRNYFYSLVFVILLGILCSLRYVGLPLAVLFLILMVLKKRKHTLQVMMLLSLSFITFAFIKGYVFSHDREFIYHLISANKIKKLILVPMAWLFGWFYVKVLGMNYLLKLITFFVGLFFLFLSARSIYDRIKNSKGLFNLFERDFLIIVPFVLVTGYYVLLALSISFFDAATPVDNRILSVLALPIILTVFTIIKDYEIIFINNRIKNILLILVSISVGRNVVRISSKHYDHGLGYSGNYWSQTLAKLEHVREFEKCADIVTNATDIMHFFNLCYPNNYSKKQSFTRLPEKFHPGTNILNQNLENDWNNVKIALREGESALLIFKKKRRSYHNTPNELKTILGAEDFVMRETDDWLIFRSKLINTSLNTPSF